MLGPSQEGDRKLRGRRVRSVGDEVLVSMLPAVAIRTMVNRRAIEVINAV
jgi:hypothetical protein